MSKNTERTNSFESAIADLGKVLLELENIRLKQLKPMELEAETKSVARAIDFVGKCIAQLNKRIEISKRLKK